MTATGTAVLPADRLPAPRIAGVRSPRRLLEPVPADGHWGWTGPLAVTAIAAVLRFTSLGQPAEIMTDETYYAKDAWALLKTGAGRQWPPGTDQKIIGGTPVPVPTDPSFVVHPDVGKWLIGLGEQLVGLTPVGWRVASAVLGTLTVFLVARIGRRLFRSTLLGCLAGLLLALDGLSIVLSRVAFLDAPLTFFLMVAFGALLVDRDRARGSYDDWLDRHDLARDRWGPRLWWRPWRLLAGVSLGLACGTKWSGAYALVVFGILTVVWDASARRAIGVRAARGAALLLDAPAAFVTIAGSAVVVYVASWIGWIRTPDGWDRQWAASAPAAGLASLLPDWVRSLWHYHAEMLDFHRGLTTPHDYASGPWGWLVLSRPFLMSYTGNDTGAPGCPVGPCSRTVLALGTPAIWWAGVLALLVCGWLWVARRDWRAGAVLAGIAATYLPWFLLGDRTIFSWYVVATAPFVVLGLALVAGLVLGAPSATARRRAVGVGLVGGYVLLVVLNAWYFWPVWSGEVIPYDAWHARMWLPRWI